MILGLLGLAALAVGLFGPLYRPKCPDCGKPASRVINCGVPAWFCFDESHTDDEGEPGAVGLGWLSALWGEVLPWDGWFCVVPGPYLPGLWRWWKAQGCKHGENE